MKESMGKKGYVQGDMSPKVEDYQRPGKAFSQEGFSKTLDYIERHNAYEDHEAKKIEGQVWKGRYS